MSKYLSNKLEPVNLDDYEPVDLLRFVHALRTNPVFRSVLHSCVEQARILQTSKMQSTGLDGMIERANSVVQSQALFTFDTFIDEIEETAREAMSESLPSDVDFDRQYDLFDRKLNG